MKKLLYCLLAVILIITSCGGDQECNHQYELQSDGTLKCQSCNSVISSPYIAVLSGSTVSSYNLISGDTVIYTNSETAKSVAIYTSSDQSLKINAPKDDVQHFGTANNVTITAVADSSYHGNAPVSGTMTVGKGHVEVNAEVKGGIEIEAIGNVVLECNTDVLQVSLLSSSSGTIVLENNATISKLSVDTNFSADVISEGSGRITSMSGKSGFQLTVATPEIIPDSDTFTSSSEVTLVCATDGATIKYTTDGTTPSATVGNVYSDPFRLGKGEKTINAIAYCADMKTSEVATLTKSSNKPKDDGDTESQTTYSYIEFGSYPQTEIVAQASDSGVSGKVWATTDDYIEDSSLYNTLEGLSEDQWDACGDSTVGGCKYRRVTVGNATKSTSSDANYYEWGSSGAYRYFKYAPIKWKVLKQDGNNYFLLSEVVLDDQMYNTNITGTLTWENSTLRSWLNGYGSSANECKTDYSSNNFIDTAFTSEEQAKIKTTALTNGDNSNSGIDGGNDTSDKIFILSETDVYGTNGQEYGFSSKYNTNDTARQVKSSTYAKAMGLYVNNGESNDESKGTSSNTNRIGNSFWWLRTPGAYQGLFELVRDSGSVYIGGQHANSKTRGVRPALNVVLSDSGSQGGGQGGEHGEGGEQGGGQGGGDISTVVYTAANTITSATTESGKTYSSAVADTISLLISTEDAVKIENPTVTKSGSSSGGDNCNFYGQNASVLVKDGSTTTIIGGTVTSDATGANGVFSYGGNGGKNGSGGDGTTVIISDTTINTTGSGSGGIMTTGGGVTNATNLTITTSGGSSAAIRTDRGGGTVTVDGGTYTTNGLGSPAIYSTAAITVSNATLVSNLSEGVCIEGKNSITLDNCNLTANNTECNGNAKFLDTIMIYQSMSGDSSTGTSTFSMTGGTLTSKKGHVFHVTNTSAVINLDGVNIINEDSANVLLSVCDDGWSGASNIATLNAANQTLTGTILVGSDSEFTLNLTEGSSFKGSFSGAISDASGNSISSKLGTVTINVASGCKCKLEGSTTGITVNDYTQK